MPYKTVQTSGVRGKQRAAGSSVAGKPRNSGGSFSHKPGY